MIHFGGGKPSVATSLQISLRLILPLIGLGILAGLGVVAGTFLLIVPGVILALMWSVAVPARVMEPIGVFDAFKRSAALDERQPLTILLLFIVVWVVSAVFYAVLMMIPNVIFGGPTSPAIRFGFQPLITAISGLQRRRHRRPLL